MKLLKMGGKMNIKSVFTVFSPKNFAQFHVQVIFILLNAVFCLRLFHEKATEFTSTDPRPEFKVLTPDSVRDFLGSSIGSKVETGLHIENFQQFDLRTGEFTVDLIVWFRFNPSVISLETIGQFSFEKGNIQKISQPKTKLINGIMLARYDVRLQFTTNLNHRLFPFNDNRIFITLVNKKVSPGELIFESYDADLSLSENMLIPGWERISQSVMTGYTEALLDRNDPSTKVFYPLAIYFIDFSRTSARHAFILLLPIFIVLYLLFISLTFAVESYKERLSLATGNIAALLGYRFVIESAAPKVGYFMLTDHIFNLFLAMGFFILFLNIAMKREEQDYLRGWSLLVLHTVLLGGIYYLVRYWMAT